MSNGHDRKSMDDVLASIRRIVRAEKEPDAETTGGTPDDGDLRDDFRARPDEPLALTPDMRMRGGDDGRNGGGVEPEAIARPAGTAWSAAATPAGSTAAAPDRETLRRMVREILLEELTSGAADGAVRGIIRDELMNGEIGGNISQNVLRLIQSEIARALENR